MRVLSLCSGLGGLDLGLHRVGAETVAFVESDPFCRRILARHWPGVPTWDDVVGLDCAALPPFDLLTAGFPCQPHSTAGKRGGVADGRWLWPAVLRIIRETAPLIVLLENVPGLLSSSNGDAMFEILTGLESAGMTVEWDCLAAGTLGAPHRRDRVFVVARRDGRWTWPAVGAQSSMFPGRRAAWPWSGRWERHTLTTCERRWPTPSPLPWEVAAEVEALPTPVGGENRASRRALLGPRFGTSNRTHWTAPGLAQAVELKSGVLPREFHDESELTPGAAQMLAEGRRRQALPTPSASLHNDGEDPERWEARRAPLAIRHGNNGAGTPLAVAAKRRAALPTPQAYSHGAESNAPGTTLLDRVVRGMTEGGDRPMRRALPTPQAHDAQGEPGAGTVARGGRERDLPGAVRRALPTHQAADGERSSESGLRGEGNPTLLGEARRRVLPTPAARDHRDPNSSDSQERRNDGSARGQQLPNELRDRGLYPEDATGRLSPTLPEWMLGLPEGWSHPNGPSLLDVPSRPYLPDLTAELALTTEREHRRPRLRALGNACQVEAAAFIARAVLASARQHGEQDRQDGAPAGRTADDESPPVSGPRLS